MRSAPILAALLLAGCDMESKVDTRPNPETAKQAGPAGPAGPANSATPRTMMQRVLLAPDGKIQALGTEPFWSIEVQVGELVYSTPENQPGTRIAAVIVNDGPRMRAIGKLDGKDLVLVIEEGQCGDGMSDTVYPMNATFTLDGRTERGCARPR